MRQSFSAIKEFKQCTRKYQETRVLKRYKSTETKQTLYGKEIHKAAEDYIGADQPLPQGADRFKLWFDKIKALPGVTLCEHQMAVATDLTPCAFDEHAWLVGIADVLNIDGYTARVLDWKTGGAKYPDTKQLELMAALIFQHYPQVRTVKGILVFLLHDKVFSAQYERKNADKIWQKWQGDVRMIERAIAEDVWNPSPSPLCGWCPVEHCEFHR